MAAAAHHAAHLPPEEPEDDRGGSMSFLDHLEEFRTRIIRSCIAIGVGMAIAWGFIDRIRGFVFQPMREALPPGATLVFTKPTEGFSVNLNIALIAGGLIAAPVILYQVWRFIAPGLYAREKRFAFPFVLLMTAGAISGAAFSHYVVFPSMIVFFGTFSSPDLLFLPRFEDAFDLYTKMLMGMSLVFQIPTLVLFLARMRLVTARFLWRNLKYATLMIFVLAAVLTPSSDPWNQLVFAAPMFGLYLLGIIIAWVAGPSTSRQTPEATSASRRGPIVLAAAVFEQARKNRALRKG